MLRPFYVPRAFHLLWPFDRVGHLDSLGGFDARYLALCRGRRDAQERMIEVHGSDCAAAGLAAAIMPRAVRPAIATYFMVSPHVMS